jgi:hypothetical protein
LSENGAGVITGRSCLSEEARTLWQRPKPEQRPKRTRDAGMMSSRIAMSTKDHEVERFASMSRSIRERGGKTHTNTPEGCRALEPCITERNDKTKFIGL